MAPKLERFYQDFRRDALQHGLTAARRSWEGDPFADQATVEASVERYTQEADRLAEGGPGMLSSRLDRFPYPGAQDSDPVWGPLRQLLEDKRGPAQTESINWETDLIVRRTPNPAETTAKTCRGLVVGQIQSGKTTNFEAVAAKLADLDYRMIIVLAGIHNALRNQTQNRLMNDLVGQNQQGRWEVLTSGDRDFDLGAADPSTGGKMRSAQSYLTEDGKTVLLVVKKNCRVLEKLYAWLDNDGARNALNKAKVLVIDDEADQASVATPKINPLIVNLLNLMPRATYIGYTATPFANVFIDPANENDLYPRDFIYSLPQPENYFGPEVLFGRYDPDRDADDQDYGKDMIRTIPAGDELLLRPGKRAEVDSFVPVITPSVEEAIYWFCLATAARWRRREGGFVDSSMLIHTSFLKQVHKSFIQPIRKVVDDLRDGVDSGDSRLDARLKQLWEREIARVPAAEWNRQPETYDQIREFLPPVLADLRIIVENSDSDERLAYAPDRSNTVLAIGGNTLSRGITLEGLVSSVFVRATTTYDTLLQMGRWFGYRDGYEDLPRIWTTEQLQSSFRHLARVEHEMRQDIAVYEREGLTPMDAVVRIRTHPALAITAKMGAAKPARIAYSGVRLETQFFRNRDGAWLKRNNDAGETFIRRLRDRLERPVALSNGGQLFRDVPARDILAFLEGYRVVEQQVDMDTRLLRDFIIDANGREAPELLEWNVALMAGGKTPGKLGELEVETVNRSVRTVGATGEHSFEGVVDIKTLMNPQDLLVDDPELSLAEAKRLSETDRKMRRLTHPELRDKALILLYPIDKDSSYRSKGSGSRAGSAQDDPRMDMNALETVLGVAIVFPKGAQGDGPDAGVDLTHMAVELPEDAEDVSYVEEEIEGFRR